MISKNAIRNSFARVKQDMLDLDNKITDAAGNIDSIKSNTQEWIMTLMNRQVTMEKELSFLKQKIVELESRQTLNARSYI